MRPAALLTIYTGKGVTPEMNLRECVSHMPLSSVNKAAHSGFETQRRCHQKSETGVSVTPKMDVCPKKNFLKKLSKFIEFIHSLLLINKQNDPYISRLYTQV